MGQDAELRNYIKKTLSDVIESGVGNRFIICPYGSMGKMVKRILNEEFGIKEICCVDNNKYNGESILPVEQLSQIDTFNVQFLLAAADYITMKALKQQINEKIQNAIIIDLLKTAEKREQFNEKFLNIMRGYAIAEKFYDWNEPGIFYWIQALHIGDTFAQLPGVRPIKMYYGNEQGYLEYPHGFRVYDKPFIKKVIVVTTKTNAAVAKLYEDVDEIIVLKSDEITCLQAYAVSSENIHPNLVCFGATSWDVWAEKFINSYVYGINVLLYELGLPREYEKEFGKFKISDNTKQAMIAYMIQNDITSERAVILFPYARSSDELSMGFWKRLVDYFVNQKGYTVFTNCAPSEDAIPGTIKLDFLIDKVAALACLGVLVIGVQSGGMDVIVNVAHNPNNIVVMPKNDNICGRGNDMWAYLRGAFGPSGTITRKENATYMYFERETENTIFDALCAEIGD